MKCVVRSNVLAVAQTHPFLERSIHSWTSQRGAPLQEGAKQTKITEVKLDDRKRPRLLGVGLSHSYNSYKEPDANTRSMSHTLSGDDREQRTETQDSLQHVGATMF